MLSKNNKENKSSYQVRTKDLPVSLRPREKFDRLGSENLSESDLIALLLRTGTTGINVIQLAESLLIRYGSLSALSRATVTELQETRGIGLEKARILKAALETARRLVQESVGERPRIVSPEEAAAVLRERARGLDREIFWVLLLDTKTRLITTPVEVFKGTLNASLIHPREIFKPAVQHSACSVILAHNHPSGDPSPSPNDIRITKKLIEAGKTMEIKVLDHLIIGRKTERNVNEFFSFRESGLAAFEGR